MEMILENMLESVNEYCKKENHQFVLSKPGEIIEYCDNGFVVSNDEGSMSFTNRKSLGNFTRYSTEVDNHYISSCIYNEDNGKFIDTGLFDVIADLVRALNSMETLAYEYDDENSEYYEEVAQLLFSEIQSYMDNSLIDILEFTGIDVNVSHLRLSNNVFNDFKKDFKTLCKLFMVADIYVEDAFDCTVRVCEYWMNDIGISTSFLIEFSGLLGEEVLAELKQEFNISQ